MNYARYFVLMVDRYDPDKGGRRLLTLLAGLSSAEREALWSILSSEELRTLLQMLHNQRAIRQGQCRRRLELAYIRDQLSGVPLGPARWLDSDSIEPLRLRNAVAARVQPLRDQAQELPAWVLLKSMFHNRARFAMQEARRWLRYLKDQF